MHTPFLRQASFPLIVVLTFLFAHSISAQQGWQKAPPPGTQPSFVNLTATQGAPSAQIRDIIKDRYGYIWLATAEGIYQHDGYTWVHYANDILDSTTLIESSVWDIFEDSRGNLWLGTNAGLDLFVRQNRSFRHFTPHPEQVRDGSKYLTSVYQTFEDSAHRLWAATSYGIALFDETRTHFSFDASFAPIYHPRRVSLSKNVLIETPDGALWSINNDGLYRVTIPESGDTIVVDRAVFLPRFSNINDIAEISNGQYALATLTGIRSWNYTDTVLQTVHLPENIMSNILSLHRVRDNVLWFNTSDEYPYLVNFTDSSYWQYQYDPIYTPTSESIGASAMMTDERNDIWIGTIHGVWKLNLHPKTGVYYRNDPDKTSYKNLIQQVAVDNAGNIYAASFDGIFRHNTDGTFEHLPYILEDGPFFYGARTLWVDANNAAWATLASREGVGVFRCEEGGSSFSRLPLGDTLNRSMTEMIFQDINSPDHVWLGTNSGLYHVNTKTWERELFTPRSAFPELPIDRVKFLYQQDADTIWTYYMGASVLGQFHPRVGTWTMIKPQTQDAWMLQGQIIDFRCVDGEHIWIATANGLVEFTISSRTFKFFNQNHGLADNRIRAVVPDQHGNIWALSRLALSQFRPADGTCRIIDLHEQIGDLMQSAMMTPDGKLVIGGTSGFYVLDQSNLLKDTIPPSVLLTNFRISDVPVTPQVPYEITRQINISSRDNIITFEFVGIHYLDPSQNQYKCMLEGFDSDWRNIGTARSMTYTNLHPGQYRFKVLAANSDGVWSPRPLDVGLDVAPTFVQTIWFRLLILAFLSSIGYVIYRNRRHQLHLRQQKEIAERSDEYKTRFLANISHEIRTPMNAILGMSRLLQDTELNVTQSQYTHAIKESSENLLHVVNDLLDHSKIESGNFRFITRAFDLEMALNQVLQTLKFRAAEKGLQFSTHIADDVPNFLLGDPVRFNQILLNLAGNAIKFTDRGAVQIHASKLAETETEVTLKFEVADTGVGIPRDRIDRIFESFTQADDDTFIEYGGTGLGLSIVRALVQQQHGSLTVDSVVGTGTTFTITLPFTKANAPEAQASPGSMPDLGPLKILVVDDTYFNQVLASEILKKYIHDVDVVIADNGQVAVEKVRQEDFDVVLMDVRMPVMNGLEATKAIRRLSDQVRSQVPIIALTASAIRSQLDQCLEAGMNACVTKPIDASTLLNEIQHLLSTNGNATR